MSVIHHTPSLALGRSSITYFRNVLGLHLTLRSSRRRASTMITDKAARDKEKLLLMLRCKTARGQNSS